jgi:hypothetical protein
MQAMIFGEPPISSTELAKFVIEQAEKLPGGIYKQASDTEWDEGDQDWSRRTRQEFSVFDIVGVEGSDSILEPASHGRI